MEIQRTGSALQTIPRPRCICFYNGTQDEPESKSLKLSDAYRGEGDIEVLVKMLNINYGRKEGRQEERQELSMEIATDLLQEGEYPVSVISRISKLSESAIKKLAAQLNVTTF